MGENYKSENNALLKQMMLALAENVNVTTPHRCRALRASSPLMVAALMDDVDSILTLIKRGADVHHQNYHGWTALHFAAYNGCLNACKALLENKANIDATKEDGETPLMVAARTNNINVFQFLFKNGADDTITNSGGKSASQFLFFIKMINCYRGKF